MSIPPSIQKLIDETNKNIDDIVDGYNSLLDTHKVNMHAVRAPLSLKDLEELSMMVTRTKCFAMKLMLSHNRSEITASEDANYSIRLQRFAQTLQEIHDFYGKLS